MPCPSEKPPLQMIAGPAAKTEERNLGQTVAIEAGKLENGKMEVTGSMERHEVEAQSNGVPYGKKPDAEKGLEQQRMHHLLKLLLLLVVIEEVVMVV